MKLIWSHLEQERVTEGGKPMQNRRKCMHSLIVFANRTVYLVDGGTFCGFLDDAKLLLFST